MICRLSYVRPDFVEFFSRSIFSEHLSIHLPVFFHSPSLINHGGISARGAAPRPGKIVGPVLRYSNCGAAAAATSIDATEQRKTVRNPTMPAQYIGPNPSYPRKVPGCKNEGGEGVGEGPTKPDLYMARKVAAAQGGPGSNWY